jgi:hypothetical protein
MRPLSEFFHCHLTETGNHPSNYTKVSNTLTTGRHHVAPIRKSAAYFLNSTTPALGTRRTHPIPAIRMQSSSGEAKSRSLAMCWSKSSTCNRAPARPFSRYRSYREPMTSSVVIAGTSFSFCTNHMLHSFCMQRPRTRSGPSSPRETARLLKWFDQLTDHDIRVQLRNLVQLLHTSKECFWTKFRKATRF